MSARATTCDNTESKRAQGPSEQSGLGATSHETETVGPTPKVSPVPYQTHTTLSEQSHQFGNAHQIGGLQGSQVGPDYSAFQSI